MKFQTKLLLAFAVLFALSMAVMLRVSIVSEQKLVSRMENNLRSIVKTVQFSTQRLAAAKGADREALEKFIQDVSRNKTVREVTIVNKDQKVVASSNAKKLGKLHKLTTGNEMVVREQLGAVDSVGKHASYTANIPIERDGRIIGLVQTSLVVDDYNQQLNELVRRNMIVAGLAFVGIFLIFSVVLFGLSRPLQQLSSAAGKIAEGDLSIQVRSTSRDEVGRLTDSFNRMAKKLAEQKDLEERLRSMEKRAILSETAAMLAHEIRNPLNLINLTADHLGHEFTPKAPELAASYQQMVESLKAEVKHLNRMVGEFLAIGKPIKIVRTTFPLRDCCLQVELLVKQHLVEKRLSMNFDIQDHLSLHADIEQIRLVLLNLLLNAIQVSPQGGAITLTASDRDGTVVIKITDSGKGIDPKNIDHVFEPYFSRRPEGIGLGLALAKRIVEEHKGQIHAKNIPGGACFEIIMPVGET